MNFSHFSNETFVSSMDSESSGSAKRSTVPESDDSTSTRMALEMVQENTNNNNCEQKSTHETNLDKQEFSDCKHTISRRERRKTRRSTAKSIESGVSSFEKEALEAVSQRLQELNLYSRDTSPGNEMLCSEATSISLSTGLRLSQIPQIGSSIGTGSSRDSSKSRRSKRGRSTLVKEDVIGHLGIDSQLSSPSIGSNFEEKFDDTEAISLRDENIAPSQKIEVFQQASTTGSLGSLEIQLKYQSAQEQLILRILSARNVPSRYLSSRAKFYVKVSFRDIENIYTKTKKRSCVFLSKRSLL